MNVLVTLTSPGASVGPFNLYSSIDLINPLVTGISRAALIAGYTLNSVPDSATFIRVKSTGTCTNSIDINITATYIMQLTTDYDLLSGACADNTATQTVTYIGNLGTGTTLDGVSYSGDVGFMKIISSTQPGFTYTGYVVNLINGLDTVYTIDTCP